MSCNPHSVVQILLNEVTQNYPGNNTHPTYFDRRIARELFIILEKHVCGGRDMSEGQTMWCDSDGTSDALSEDNDALCTPVHNTATGSSSYEPSPPKLKRKTMHEQFSKIIMQMILWQCQYCKEKRCSNCPKIQDIAGKSEANSKGSWERWYDRKETCSHLRAKYTKLKI